MSRRFRTASLAVVMSLGLIAADEPATSLFNGTPSGWKTNTGKPLAAKNVQADGLNPHKSGGYLVVHETPRKDFVLEFDYKLTKGCNSGVFLRVGNLKDPVMTGLEIAIDDTEGTGFHDTGAFYDLVKPTKNAQKPVGEWNHMVIAANGPKISVTLNGEQVSEIDLDRFPEAGKRPDGSDHKFKTVVVKDFNREGHFGFQDHGSDCWYKNIMVR